MKCLDVVKEDMQEVGEREDEVFGCGEVRGNRVRVTDAPHLPAAARNE